MIQTVLPPVKRPLGVCCFLRIGLDSTFLLNRLFFNYFRELQVILLEEAVLRIRSSSHQPKEKYYC